DREAAAENVAAHEEVHLATELNVRGRRVDDEDVASREASSHAVDQHGELGQAIDRLLQLVVGPVQPDHPLAGDRAGDELVTDARQEVANETCKVIVVELAMARMAKEVLAAPRGVRILEQVNRRRDEEERDRLLQTERRLRGGR